MAWFERNPGVKTGPDAVPEKIPEAVKPVVEPVQVNTGPEPKPAAKIETPPQPSIAGLVGYLYKGSRVSGQLNFQGPARIDGAVDGEIHCQGKLTIGASAEIKAKITAQVVVIQGKVEGNVSAKESIELVTPARLIGNIDTPKLIISEGVVFDGDCSMGVAKQKGGAVGSQSVVVEVAAPAQTPKAAS